MGRWQQDKETALSLGRGWPATAFSSAVAGRVRGFYSRHATTERPQAPSIFTHEIYDEMRYYLYTYKFLRQGTGHSHA
jgi:hypothetical protein